MEKTYSEIEIEILDILRQFLQELGSERALRTISIESYLDRDLGIDSLGRVELLYRVEKHFDIKLPTTVMAEAEVVRDIILGIQHLAPVHGPKKEFIKKLPQSTIDPSSAETLIDLLILYGENEPNRPHIYLQDEVGEEQKITYGDLYQNALSVARGLATKGIKMGETVAIMLPTSPEFFYAFMGILLAGGIPVPIYPPFRPDRIGEYAVREASILKNAEVRILITFHRAEILSRLLRVFIPSLKEVLTVLDLSKFNGDFSPRELESESAALIQYTSGSTSDPKGVLLTHYNLLSNIRAYGKAADIKPDDVCVSWLPLYHDMGLIGSWLGSFYFGIPATLLSPLMFLNRPEQWLWAIHYHRATVSAGPNFAYELCVRKVNEKDIQGLDLSSWRLALNGAEAINPNTLRRFTKKFAPYGFREETFLPVYGLAESSVALTFPPLNRKPKIDKIKREEFESKHLALPITDEKESALEFVACGVPLEHHAIRIVDDKNNVLPDRQVGNLQFQGPSAMQGYYRNSAASQKIFHQGFWETGDLGYIFEGEIYITGRKKDIIIKAGRNYYPEEIEITTAQVPGVRKGCVVAFGVSDSKTGTEKLVVVAETRETNLKERARIREEIIDRLTTALAVPPDHIILVPPNTILKTSSGKLRRSSCKEDYLSHKIGKAKTPTWWQFLKLGLLGTWHFAKKWFSNILKAIYTSYFIIYWLLAFLPIFITTMSLPRPLARKFAKFCARFSFRVALCPIKIHDKHNLTRYDRMVYVANHSSYIDALIFLAILPSNTAIVAKQELNNSRILSALINKLQHVVIERWEFTKSVADVDNIQNALKKESVAIFPEGTFTYADGVRQFKLGAFKCAVSAEVPICPISIRGARKILRSGNFLLRPGKIEIRVLEPVLPESDDWQEIARLRNLVRKKIAKFSGEEIINV
jgi:fatty-acyl-CoA synthase